LAQLSPAHREVLELVYYHQKWIDDVARIVGIPPNTVKTRMFYARSRLGQLLEHAGIGGP
jgi:RNA polymerase sigma-70 factor (ECF subfamily)